MKKNMVVWLLLLVILPNSAIDNPFTIKKERKVNRRSVKQHCCEYCVEIVKKAPSVNRLLAQLQRALISKSGTEKLMILVTHAQERMGELQELVQQAVEDYWNSEKQGMWQEAPANRFVQREGTLKELYNFLSQWSQSLSAIVKQIQQNTKLQPQQLKALTDSLQEKEQRLKQFIEAI